MRKLFILALITVMFTGCGQNQVSTSSEGTKVTESTQVTTIADTMIVTTTGTAADITSIDTATSNTAPAATTAPQTAVTTKPMTIITQTITQAAPPPATTSASSNSSFQQEVVNLVNAERAKAGLNQLSISSETEKAAQVRAGEIITLMEHTRPNGTSCFTALDEQGINYTSSGENIAGGQTTPAEVMETWMNSPGHKANILNPKFTHMGVGYAQGGEWGTNWVQMFVKLA